METKPNKDPVINHALQPSSHNLSFFILPEFEFRVRDFKNMSLNVETDPFKISVSSSRQRLRYKSLEEIKTKNIVFRVTNKAEDFNEDHSFVCFLNKIY